MYDFTVFNKLTGEVISNGSCSSERDVFIQNTKPDTSVFQGTANRLTQKIENPSQFGTKPNGFLKIVDKTPAEIKAPKPRKRKIILTGEQPAGITNNQWQAVEKRFDKLEKLLLEKG